ncbi:hypothetical protein L596_005716 [Steinernema carpocapsae]|uniref:Uncharacterized protein n=1 Tax=Steinernema carpocapsae TaxID=34508 RepID=A0A4U8V159_STECR|nr:hypothetical protein L596_005716 [Steinernema carpocapsae]
MKVSLRATQITHYEITNQRKKESPAPPSNQSPRYFDSRNQFCFRVFESVKKGWVNPSTDALEVLRTCGGLLQWPEVMTSRNPLRQRTKDFPPSLDGFFCVLKMVLCIL